MIPFNLGSNWVTILVCILGLGMMGYGFYLLKKNIEPLLIQEDEEEKEY
jgi:predicted membrane protein